MDVPALTHAVDHAARTLGRLDILVNSAGVAIAGERGGFALADFDHTLNVNVRTVFVATQAAVRHMGQGGAWGRVITMAAPTLTGCHGLASASMA